jgi:hypothetical protein
MGHFYILLTWAEKGRITKGANSSWSLTHTQKGTVTVPQAVGVPLLRSQLLAAAQQVFILHLFLGGMGQKAWETMWHCPDSPREKMGHQVKDAPHVRHKFIVPLFWRATCNPALPWADYASAWEVPVSYQGTVPELLPDSLSPLSTSTVSLEHSADFL